MSNYINEMGKVAGALMSEGSEISFHHNNKRLGFRKWEDRFMSSAVRGSFAKPPKNHPSVIAVEGALQKLSITYP